MGESLLQNAASLVEHESPCAYVDAPGKRLTPNALRRWLLSPNAWMVLGHFGFYLAASLFLICR